MVKQTYVTTIKNDAGASVVADTVIYSAPVEENISKTVTAGTVGEVDVAVDVSQIVAFFIESDQAVTLKLNSTSSPAAPSPVSLVAGKAYWWNSDRHDANPLTVDITKLFFDNVAGLKDAVVKAGFLLNV